MLVLEQRTVLDIHSTHMKTRRSTVGVMYEDEGAI
jgi:hypothetical protein